MKSAEAMREAWSHFTLDLRDLAQQCYLLIALTEDSEMKAHLLELGLELERRAGLIEGAHSPHGDAGRSSQDRR